MQGVSSVEGALFRFGGESPCGFCRGEREMKRFLAFALSVLLALCCAVGFAACTERPDDETDGPVQPVDPSDPDGPGDPGDPDRPVDPDDPDDPDTPHEHTFGEWVVTVPATCTEPGEEQRTCSCGETETRAIEALGHTEVIDEAVAPTCTGTGLTEGKHCSVCNEVLVEQETLPSIPHNYVDGICTMCGTIDESGGTEGLVFTLSDDGTHYSVTGYIGSAKEVYVPSVYQGLPVTVIGDSAFRWCKEFESVTIGNGVRSIGEFAFFGCINLTSIIIPDSVTFIGEQAFSSCDQLASMMVSTGNPVYHSAGNCLIETESKTLIAGCKNSIIPDDGSVIIIGDSSFSGCTNLTGIEIPDSVTQIGESAFFSCYGLRSITIPDGVTSIGFSSFWSCVSLRSITIPDSVTSVGEYAFFGCSSLTSIEIPDGVTSIGVGAFYDCVSLTSIEIPDSVTSIGVGAASGCINLSSLTVSTGNPVYHSAGNCLIETESKMLIQGCSASVIPADGSVTSIGNYAFNFCADLTSIAIPDSVTSIGDYAFAYCADLTSIEIPDSVTSIGRYAFNNCPILTSVTIGDGVTLVEYGAFAGCISLSSLTVSTGNPVYHSAGNCLIETESKTLIAGCKNSVIPDDGSVIIIGDSSFSGCTSLTGIEIPDSVTLIGECAFSGCDSLTSIEIPDSVTSIGEYAFYNCTNLTSIEIPDSVTSIGDSAFAWCDSLTGVTIGDSVTLIGQGAFSNCDSLTSITIPDSVTTIRGTAFEGCDSLTSAMFENPNGWNADGEAISAEDLSNPATAAEYLTDNYDSYIWIRD